MDSQNRQVYNNIAKEFNNTRWIPWPCTQKFLNSLPQWSFGCEAGCGNGRNILYRKDLCMIGFDFCDNFCKIVKEKGGKIIQSDIRSIPFKNNLFDFVISIAVIHHLDTFEKRLKSVLEMTRILRKGGKLLILVWAFEQEKDSRRKFKTQDELVTWKARTGKTYYRYYHLYKKGELEEMIKKIDNLRIKKSFFERSNYGVICEKI